MLAFELGKPSACNAGDLGSIPGLGRFPGGGHGNPLQYSCQENPMDRGAWRATVHGVTKEWDTEQLTHRAGKANGRRRDHVHVRLKAALQAAALKAGLGLSLALRWTWAWALGLGGGWECGERTAGPWGGD